MQRVELVPTDFQYQPGHHRAQRRQRYVRHVLGRPALEHRMLEPGDPERTALPLFPMERFVGDSGCRVVSPGHGVCDGYRDRGRLAGHDLSDRE